MACEEAQLYYRWQLLEQIAKGEMPEGMTAEDLIAMELPLPGEVEMAEDPDGTLVIRRVEKKATEDTPARTGRKKKAAASAFVCDTPDDQ
jgi:hypothetical protein